MRFISIVAALGVLLSSAMPIPRMLKKIVFGKDPFDPGISLVVKAKAYNARESKKFLNHNLLAKGVQPIEITIENHTGHQYSLCPSSLDIPQLSPGKAVDKVFFSAIPRQIALKVLGFFFWPVAIPSTLDGLYVHTMKKKLEANYAAKSLKKAGEVIPEYATVYRVIFVSKKEMAQEIEFDLIDLETFSSNTLKTSIEKEI